MSSESLDIKPFRSPFVVVPWKSWQAVWIFLCSWIGIPLLLTVSLRYAAPHNQLAKQLLTGLQQGSIGANFALAFTSAIAGLSLVLWVVYKTGATWRDLGLRKFNVLRAVALVAVTFVVFILLAWLALTLASVLIPHFNANQAQSNDFTAPKSSAGRNLSFVALVLLPPIFEETVFRGFMFPAFAGRYGDAVGAVATSILFGLAHLQGNVTVYTIILSLLLCYMYKRTGSIIPGMALHMLNNYLAFSVMVK